MFGSSRRVVRARQAKPPRSPDGEEPWEDRPRERGKRRLALSRNGLSRGKINSTARDRSPSRMQTMPGKSLATSLKRKRRALNDMRLKIDKAFRIAKPMRKASWTKRFAGGWGERRGANGDGGSGGEGWREWAGGVSEKSLPMRAALEKPRPLWLENAASRCRNRCFRLPTRQGYGTPKRGYSPRSRVRQLPQWGHRGRAAS